jgi:outer membrane immunogenic protein
MKKILLAALAATSLTSVASAADMAARMPMKAPPIVSPAYNWTGFYIGAMGGYGWSDEVRARAGGVVVALSTDELRGGFVGGTLGYNWQMGQWVIGLEADAAWSDMRVTDTVLAVTLQDRIRAFGSVTGRIGILAAPSMLLYAKGGFAWADNRISATAGLLTFAESNVHTGWTIGGGGEWKFAPNWSAKVEYMYADYGYENYLAGFVAGGVDLAVTTHTIKGGINYQF